MVAESITSLSRRARRILASGTSTRAQKFQALYALSLAYFKAGKAAESARTCSDARAYLPPTTPEDANAIAHVLLGSAQHQVFSGNLLEAPRQFDRAVLDAGEWCDAETAVEVRLAYIRFLHTHRRFGQASAMLLLMNKTSETCKLLASCHVQQRKFEAAMKSYNEAIRLLTPSGRRSAPARARVYCDMTRAMRLAGHMSYAQQHLNEAQVLVSQCDAPEQRAIEPRLLCEEAALALATNHFDKAIQRYEEAIQLMQNMRQETTLDFAEALIGLAMSYLTGHRYGAVEALLISALRIMRLRLGPRSFDSASVLNKLAGFYKKEGRFVEASALLSGVEAIQGKAHLIDPFMEHTTHFAAGLNYQADGHYVLAINRYKQALRQFEKLDPAKSYDAVAIHIRMYEIYTLVADPVRAESHYIQAGVLLHEMFGYQQPDQFRCAMTLAACFDMQDEDDYADSFYICALESACREGRRDRLLQAREEYAAMLIRNGRRAEAKAVRSRWRLVGRSPARKPRLAATV